MGKKREEPDYDESRKKALKRDKYTCQYPGCGCRYRKILQVHHILEYSKYKSLRTDIGNLITLCIKCHKNIKGKERYYVQMFLDILKNKRK